MKKHIGEALNKTKEKKFVKHFDGSGGNVVKIKMGTLTHTHTRYISKSNDVVKLK